MCLEPASFAIDFGKQIFPLLSVASGNLKGSSCGQIISLKFSVDCHQNQGLSTITILGIRILY